MVDTTEDRPVRVVYGRWARTCDCGWLFIANSTNPTKKLRIHEGDGYSRTKQIIMDGFGLNGDVYVTFQWPEWMDVGSSATWKKTCPVTISNDEAMEIYFAMCEVVERDELVMSLYVSQVSVEDSVDANALQILKEKRKSVMGDGEQFVQQDAVFEIAVDNVELEGDELFIGRVFKNKQDCKTKLSEHALNRHFHFRHDRLCKNVTTFTCLSDSCPWCVYIVKLEGSDNYQIRSASLRHTCFIEDRGQYNKLVRAKFMESLMKPMYDDGGSRGPLAKELQKLLLDDHNAKVSYWKSHDLAKEEVESSFGLLPSYVDWLRQASPESDIQLHMERNRFKYLFLAFSASLKGFTKMRRVIVLDGTHLLGSFTGCLLTATCQDPNFQEYPLAFGIVDGLNDDAWKWFLRRLRRVIPDCNDLAFVSDWQSSVISALRRVYPKASHGACLVHLQRVILSDYNDRHLADLVSKAARACRVDDFHAAFAEIGSIEPECATYLEEIGFNHWTRSHFMGKRFNIMTSDIAKSVNAAFKEAREFPIVPLLEFIQTTLSAWFDTRRKATEAETSPFPPNVRALIRRNLEISERERLTARRVDEFEYEVKGDTRRLFYVHLRRKTCTCREYNLLGIPCAHAICAAVAEGIAIHEL